MNKINTYRDLIVWRKAMNLVTDIYKTTGSFPANEQNGLISQIRRCSVSIPSNIAEGYGRYSPGEYIRYLQIASGSLCELQTQIELSKNLEYLNEVKYEFLYESSKEIERMLSILLIKLKNKQ